jgi:hypothetical protein
MPERRSLLVLGLALVAVICGSPGSAHAAVAALERASANSAEDSSFNRTVTVNCPAGKRVTGAAGGIIDGGGQVLLRQLRPDPTLTSVTVQGQEDQNGLASTWFLTARAICATPPAGLERVAATSSTNSSDKSATATCPIGKRLLGTGAEMAGAGRQVELNDIIPAGDLQSVTVQGLEDEDGTTATWSVTAYAVCANPVEGAERVFATSLTDSQTIKSVTATCPAGKQLTGVGGEIGGGGGEVVLDELTPTADLTGVGVVGVEDEDGTAGDWLVRSFALCAASSQRVVGQSPSDSNDKGAVASCPAGKQVTGAGGDITSGAGQVVIDGIVPNSALTQVSVFGFEDGNGFAGSWLLRSWAICATPRAGLQRVSQTSSLQSTGLLLSNADCPVGRQVVGVGGDINGGDGEVLLSRISPASDLTNSFAGASEDETGFANNWTLTAHEICATSPAGLELVTETSDPASDPASVTATCPSGKNLLGMGAAIDSGQLVLDDVRPNALLTSVIVTAIEDETGFDGDWTVQAHAICANA